MNRTPEEIVARAMDQRATALDMLRRVERGESPLPGYGVEAAGHMLRQNIEAYDEIIRRNS